MFLFLSVFHCVSEEERFKYFGVDRAVMGKPIVKCKNCGREVEPRYEYCPYCGLLVHFPDKMKYSSSDILRKRWTGNIDLFKETIENPSEVLKIVGRMEETESKIVKKQREFTDTILGRFPIIKERIKEDQSLTFYAGLIDIPYIRKGGDYQHDCIQEKISVMQDGLVNIAVGSQEISSYLYTTDLAIWAVEEHGESLLSKQSRMLLDNIPDGQRRFLISAEPWYICSRVYNYEGTWLIWKLLFKTHGLKEWVSKNKCTPINFQRLSGLEYSSLFPIGGTKGGGEIILTVVEKSEKEALDKALNSMVIFDKFELDIERKEIEISWETLQDLGIICQAAVKTYSGKSSHVFTKRMADNILQAATAETGGYAEKANVSEFEEENFLTGMAQTLIKSFKMEWYDGVYDVIQVIPRDLRKKYRVEFKGGL